MKTYTRGNVIVEDIKVGDILYEYEMNTCCTVEVLTLPVLEDEKYTWMAKVVSTGKVAEYMVHTQYAHYAPKLYNYKAYEGAREI
jgi:hypothetical protein